MLVLREGFRDRFVLNAFQIERDANSKRSRAAEEGIELHASPISSSSTIHRLSMPAATSGTALALCHSHNASHISPKLPPPRTTSSAAVSSGSSERYCVLRSCRQRSQGCARSRTAGCGAGSSLGQRLEERLCVRLQRQHLYRRMKLQAQLGPSRRARPSRGIRCRLRRHPGRRRMQPVPIPSGPARRSTVARHASARARARGDRRTSGSRRTATGCVSM